MTDFVYSIDQINWFNSATAVHKNLTDVQSDHIKRNGLILYKGEHYNPRHKDILTDNFMVELAELIDSYARRFTGEQPESTIGYLEEITDQSAPEFKKHIVAWLDGNVDQPSFMGVDNIKIINPNPMSEQNAIWFDNELAEI
ncbi:MAG: hypothetical protein COB24_09030 [Hyphomicrobiales bacterium]|nr:MAG: hypothetical protein COB24_09030 [Hyphomicrobiales bacterium]